MRAPQVPVGAIALLSSGVGVLAVDNYTSCWADEGRRTPSNNHERLNFRCADRADDPVRRSIIDMFFKPLMSGLLPLGCRADASGYDAMEAAPSSQNSSARALPSASYGTGGGDGDGDTITGVFHRLDSQRAKLLLVQVVFR
jgi:hypothetical protein